MNEWKTFTGRLLWAMSRAGKTNQSELARAVGVKPQSIQYLCHAESNAQGSTHTAALARELRVSADWLATGQGQAAALAHTGWQLDEPAAASYAAVPAARVPVVGHCHVDGRGELKPSDPSSGTEQSNGHVLTPIVAPNLRALRVKGHALSPYAKDGQYLLLQAAPEPLPLEDILVLTLADGRQLIRELLHQRGGKLTLLPIHGGQPEVIDMDDIQGIAAVVCVVPKRWWQAGQA